MKNLMTWVIAIIPLLVGVIIWCIFWHTGWLKDNPEIIQPILFILINAYVLIVSNLRLRDNEGKIDLTKKNNIAKLPVIIVGGVSLFALLAAVSAEMWEKEAEIQSQRTVNLSREITTSKKNLSRQLANTKDFLQSGIRGSEERLNDELNRVDSALRTDIGATRDTLKDSIRVSRDSLTRQLGEVDTRLSDSISASEGSLIARIGSVDSALRTDIRATRDTLKDSIRVSRDSMSIRLTEVDSGLRYKIGESERKLIHRIDSTNAALKESIYVKMDSSYNAVRDSIINFLQNNKEINSQ